MFRAGMPISPETMDGFYDYCVKTGKKIDKEELKKDEQYLKTSLRVELVRAKLGEKEAREEAVLADNQVAVAVDIIHNGGKISKALYAKYPKKAEPDEKAGEKKLEEERNKLKENE